MYFYISFLRPPPLQASPSGTLVITPQIANDLRTEHLDCEQDIYFYWYQCLSATDATLNTVLPPAIKLTTWRKKDAYKEISVPPPRGVREGQWWCFVLTSQRGGTQSQIIDLGGDAMGAVPFPVISMPILFSARRVEMRGKQEKIRRVYRIRAPAGEPVHLTLQEQTSFDLDKKVWDSGVGLGSWLIGLRDGTEELGKHRTLSVLREALFAQEERTILELGTGSGIVSLTLAVLRSSLNALGNGVIFATDRPSAMPLLEQNISINEHLFPSARPRALVLDWDEELPDIVTSIHGGVDVIVMADVAYNVSSFPSLIRTLSNLVCLQSNRKPPLLLLGYKERDTSERTLWDLARDIGIIFERVGERPGAGCECVEVWVGAVVRAVTDGDTTP